MKTIVLVGSGHAHLEAIKHFSTSETAKNNYILISPFSKTFYSGLIPAYIAADVNDSELTIDSKKFAIKKGFKFIQDAVESINLADKSISLINGGNISYDILSVNAGGSVLQIPCESKTHLIYLRPFEKFIAQWQEFLRKHITNNNDKVKNSHLIVIGGGAAATEFVIALKNRFDQNTLQPYQKVLESNLQVTLITQSSRLCSNYSELISDKLLNAVQKLGIHVVFNEKIDFIHSDFIKLLNGQKLNFSKVFIATPVLKNPLISQKSDKTLRVSSTVFNLGDGAELTNYPELPKSGVLAIHQGRHLFQSIIKILNNQEPDEFNVRKNYLNILRTGHKKARFVWGNFSFEGRIPFLLKRWIDRAYINSFTNTFESMKDADELPDDLNNSLKH